ncbi:MAG: DNA gyrase inhibitor YacG [Rhodocyclaceae bacterium]
MVQCPHCGKPVEWGPQSPFRPFCSERCKQIDLGAWANDEYRIPGAAPPDDFSPPNGEPTPRG